MGQFLKQFYAQGGWRKQAVDQSAHFVWGVLLALPLAYYGAPIWLCAAAPLITAAPREFVDQRPVNSWVDTLTDMAVMALGGAIIGWGV